MAVSPRGFTLLGTASLHPSRRGQVTAFRPPASLSKRLPIGWSSSETRPKSSLAYGPGDGDEESDFRMVGASSPFLDSKFSKHMDHLLDPACSIDDEDCLALSSLGDRPLPFDPNASEDPLCDPEDVDCQAFAPDPCLRSDARIASDLRARSNSIERERVRHNWRTAHCPTSFVPLSDSDYVRRVHMETWPIAVCGSARGGVYVINLEEKSLIGKVEGAHTVQVERGSGASETTASQAMEKMYGKLDGGGVVAVAIREGLVASSGREGGVRLWRIGNGQLDRRTTGTMVGTAAKGGDGKLTPLGSLPGLKNTIVTSLKFDSNGVLWAAGYDGTVRGYSTSYYKRPDAWFAAPKPLFTSDFTDSVLDMQLCEELDLGVCATADGGAALFSLEDGQFFVGIMLFEVAARSVLIMKHVRGEGYALLCGGADGVIHRIPLNVSPRTGKVDEEDPFGITDTTETSIEPRHAGPVMIMASPDDGMFVTGGQDGTLRVWDCSEVDTGSDNTGDPNTGKRTLQTKCIHALTGYKLWLGSACTDGKRLISDGGENSVIVRDFSHDPRTNDGQATL